MIPTESLLDFEHKMEAIRKQSEKERIRKESEEWKQEFSESKEPEQ